MALITNDLTPKDIEFLKFQKSRGVDAQIALQKLSEIKKSKSNIEQPISTMGTRFAESFKQTQQKGVEKFQRGAGEFIQRGVEGDKLGAIRSAYRGMAGIAKGTAGALYSGVVGAAQPALERVGTATKEFGKNISELTPDIIENAIKGEVNNMGMVLKSGWDLLSPEKKKQITELLGDTLDVADFTLTTAALPGFAKGIAEKAPTVLAKAEQVVETAKQVPSGVVSIAKQIPEIRVPKGIGETAGKVKEFAVAQTTGLSPTTVETIKRVPDLFEKAQAGQITREAIAEKSIKAIEDLKVEKGYLGKAYQPIRESTEIVKITGGEIDDILKGAGLKITDSGIEEVSKLASNLSKKDLNAINEAYDLVRGKTELSGNEVLNLRQKLDTLVDYKSEVSTHGQKLVKQIRSSIDNRAKSQLTGLRELDKQFAETSGQFRKIRKDYFHKDGTLKDNALSKLSNLSNKGREQALGRLEELVPGISDEIKALKAMEDVAAATGQKVGAYTRAAMKPAAGLAILSGNPILAIPVITYDIITTPKIAANIIKNLAKKKLIKPKAIDNIIHSLQTAKGLNKRQVNILKDVIEEIPEIKTSKMTSAATNSELGIQKDMPFWNIMDESRPEKIKKIEADIMEEMYQSTKGERIFADGEVSGLKSTFPQWIPSDLRLKGLFDDLMENLVDGNRITKKPELELLEAIRDEAARRLGKIPTVKEKIAAKKLTSLDKKGIIEGTKTKGMELKTLLQKELSSSQMDLVDRKLELTRKGEYDADLNALLEKELGSSQLDLVDKYLKEKLNSASK
jgi:hypothetical protein